MAGRRLLFLVVLLLLLGAGSIVARAQQTEGPLQSVGVGIRPDGSRDLLSPATTRQRGREWTKPDPEPPPKACLDVSPGPASITPQPEAIDPVTLTVLKSWVSGAWQLALGWTGSSGPFTVSYSTTPSFQNGVQTLQQGTSSTGLTQNADTSKNLECFEVTDASAVSEPVQGMGYDPTPAPTVPTFASSFYWWGQDVTLSANYLDPIPQNNVSFFYELPIRAHLATPIGNGYASNATFTIPDDSRSAYMYIQAHGRTSPPSPAPVQYLRLSPPNVGPYTSIRGISYARTTGKVWVAANGLVQEADIFLRTPATGYQFTDATKPYISRETTDGRILYVDGVSGVSSVWQVDVSSGTRTLYALTTDTQFTRLIRPVGLAVDPDGSACYIADANQSRVVKIPANNGSNIVDTWGNRTFSFPDPCGIDANIGHQIVLGTSSWQTWIISGQYSSTFQYYTNSAPNCLEIDRDVATASWFPWVYSDAAFCEGFNQHTFTTPGGGTANPRYHGAQVWADTTGVLVLTPDWTYAVYHHYPQKVIINNMGQPQVYPSPWQSQDRVIRLDMTGWPSAPLRLRLIDPADVSGYAPDGGFPPRYDTSVPPYEAKDDYGPADSSVNTDYGLTFSSDGSGATTTPLIGYPDSNFNLTVYLKVPARYSGDNYEVEVTKCALGTPPTPLPQRIPFLSSAYTSWKRVWVERDHMFRRGAVLFQDYGATGKCGGAGQPPCCGTGGQLPCNQIMVYDWTNASVNDTVVVFDESTTAENGGEQRTISAIGAPSGGTRVITLNASLANNYLATSNDGLNPPNPIFTNGHSGGFGVTYSTVQVPPGSGKTITDTSPNQINGTGSAFYDADMRGIQQPFDDAYVEFYALRSGMGAVPFLPRAWFSLVGNDSGLRLFHQIWFKNKSQMAPPNMEFNNKQNYFHLIGASEASEGVPPTVTWVNGISYQASDVSYVFGGSIEAQCSSCTPTQSTSHYQETTDHEIAHLFGVNVCNAAGHDANNAWCSGATECTNPSSSTEFCIMHTYDAAQSLSMRTDGIARLDCDDVAATGSSCGIPNCATDGVSVRTDVDPE